MSALTFQVQQVLAIFLVLTAFYDGSSNYAFMVFGYGGNFTKKYILPVFTGNRIGKDNISSSLHPLPHTMNSYLDEYWRYGIVFKPVGTIFCR